ncbi:lactamase, partial [Chloroflexota bacterium]
MAVPVSHSTPAVGYQVTSPDGKTLFYTGDTGAGLADCWQQVSPQLLIIEVTASNEFQEVLLYKGHLTPGLLAQELESFRKIKGYLPQVITVHMSPG